MQKFVWEGRAPSGELIRGELQASSQAAVRAQLRRQRVVPSRIRAERVRSGISLRFRKKVKEKEVAVFTRQLATMIDAGLPLVQSLDILATQQENRSFKESLLQVKADVEGGATFSDSLQKQPKVFSELYINLVMAGEVGGMLDIILNRLSVYMEKAIALKKRVKGAMVYPSAILSVSVLVVMVLLIFVIPVFQKMFSGFGAALPAPTLFVIKLSTFVKSNSLFVCGALVGLVVAIQRYYHTASGRRLMDSGFLKAPVFGPLLLKIAIARFTRTLGTLVSSGVPILDGLLITAKTSGNTIVEEAVMKTRVSISEGKTIAEPLAASSVFPPMVVQMIGVGETTGSLDAMLNKIADFYDEEVNATVAALTSLLEPLMMVFLGILIGGMMVAMYLPIFKMASVIQ